MNPAHAHLVVNHLPLFASLFAVGLLGFGVFRQVPSVTRAGLVFALVGAVGGVIAVKTGERAEEMVEDLAGVSHAALEPHEEAGEAVQFAAIVAGLLALGALVTPSKRETHRRAMTLATLLASIVLFGMSARAANLGGPIRHPEISNSTPAPEHDAESENDEHQGR